MMVRRAFALSLTAVLVACSSSSESEPFTCSLGEMQGSWRMTYRETNGTCGPIPDETVVATPGSGSGDPGCTLAAQNISPDKCTMELDFTCPTTDKRGTQRWVGSHRQVAGDRVEGSMTLQLEHAELGRCRSTYAMTMQRQ